MLKGFGVIFIVFPSSASSRRTTRRIWTERLVPRPRLKTPWRNTGPYDLWWGNKKKKSGCWTINCERVNDAWCLLQPPTPNLEEDLKEVLRSEAGIELIVKDESPAEQKPKVAVRIPDWWRRFRSLSLSELELHQSLKKWCNNLYHFFFSAFVNGC